MGDFNPWPSDLAGSGSPPAGAVPTGDAGAGVTAAMAGAWGAPVRLIRTFSSPSVISSSAIPDASTRSISFFSLRRSMFGPQRILQRKFVALAAQAADHADCEIGKVRAVAEFLARKHVRQMHLDKRNPHRRQRIAHRNTGMRERRGIDDDEIPSLALRLFNAVDQIALDIALEAGKRDSGRFGVRGEPLINGVERVRSVMLGLANA